MNDFFMTPEEAKILAWIHSNKFITTKLFHKRFRPNNTFQTACNDLNRLSKEKGFLKPVKAHKNADSFYFCNRGTLTRLKQMGLILTAPEIRAPHQNTFEKEHDKTVIEIRIQYEKDPVLKDLVWLSDYEMRIGYRMEWRKALNDGRIEDLQNVRLQKVIETSRIPDAHFEANIHGKPWAFILEFERSRYGKTRIQDVRQKLDDFYPGEIKLIVAEKESRIQLLKDKFRILVKDEKERAYWWFCDLPKVLAHPFLETPWVDLDDFHPAIITPGKK